MSTYVSRPGSGPDSQGDACAVPGCLTVHLDAEVHNVDTDNYGLTLHRFEGGMSEGDDEGTVRRVHEAMTGSEVLMTGAEATDLIRAMQNAGILFRERRYGSCTFQMPDGEICGAPYSSSLHQVVHLEDPGEKVATDRWPHHFEESTWKYGRRELCVADLAGNICFAPKDDPMHLPDGPEEALKISLWERYSQAEAEASQEFLRVLAIIRKKNAMYGDAWRQQGYMGNLARILSKAARLKAVMWRSDPPPLSAQEGETVLDTARDLIALAAFFIINYEQENGWGSSE